MLPCQADITRKHIKNRKYKNLKRGAETNNWEKHNIFDTEDEAIAGLTELFVGSQTD
jgi:hypothetical protein